MIFHGGVRIETGIWRCSTTTSSGILPCFPLYCSGCAVLSFTCVFLSCRACSVKPDKSCRGEPGCTWAGLWRDRISFAVGLKDLHIKELLINRLAPKITSVTSYKMNQHHLLREGVCVCVCMRSSEDLFGIFPCRRRSMCLLDTDYALWWKLKQRVYFQRCFR